MIRYGTITTIEIHSTIASLSPLSVSLLQSPIPESRVVRLYVQRTDFITLNSKQLIKYHCDFFTYDFWRAVQNPDQEGESS